MSVQELEQAVSRLESSELDEFANWFEQFRADEWDRQIASDAQAGKLDALAARAEAHFESGNCTQL